MKTKTEIIPVIRGDRPRCRQRKHRGFGGHERRRPNVNMSSERTRLEGGGGKLEFSTRGTCTPVKTLAYHRQLPLLMSCLTAQRCVQGPRNRTFVKMFPHKSDFKVCVRHPPAGRSVSSSPPPQQPCYCLRPLTFDSIHPGMIHSLISARHRHRSGRRRFLKQISPQKSFLILMTFCLHGDM